ncbi:ATP synthase F1 subunit delta [Porifericola rhodea]|uniref:ATP synthase F1 subunit delta n=1 Tax=Porifericola rhodea TaxID=930972 RepID=UPI0026659936|nr:ATP synthase F1 subunit delta [Porifericola rhodea]WKN29990.1 ATP synthase F1 subunit delta [Porifericola rhodea]
MVNSRVASRYAKSLLGLAVEKNVLKEVYQDMMLFKETCKANRDFVLMLRNPIISHEKKKAVLYALFQDKFHPITLTIFDVITRKNREAYLPAIAESFENQYRHHQGIAKAIITSSVPLTEKLREEVTSLVAKQTGKKVELEEHVDSTLIGGFVLKIGDQQMDNSVKAKLKALTYEFADNSFVKSY